MESNTRTFSLPYTLLEAVKINSYESTATEEGGTYDPPVPTPAMMSMSPALDLALHNVPSDELRC